MAFFRLMKTAAHWRHAILVATLFGHDRETWKREVRSHRAFVDLVYSPWV